ncbi:MAG: DUF86 domain-containing protein [Anaerolineae bacterium]|jgi:uncharacterized protein with HEPN domain
MPLPRRVRGYLFDALRSAQALEEFVRGKTLDDYQGSLLLRSAVERQFEIIGEALNQLSQRDPLVASRISQIREAIAFRNLLIHGYATVDHNVVWDTLHVDLPKLRRDLEIQLAESEEEGV